jgi:hypothetical protein
MEPQNKKNQFIKRMGIYSFMVVFTILMNIPIYGYITWHLIVPISNYLSNHIKYLHIEPFIWFDGIGKVLSIDLMINIFLLLIIEFVIIVIFGKKLNALFRINNLFTIKKSFFFRW